MTCNKCGAFVSPLDDEKCFQCGAELFPKSKGHQIDEAEVILREALEKIEKLNVKLRCSDGYGRIGLDQFPVLEVE